MDCQFISIYGKFVTSKPASFSREDIRVYILQDIDSTTRFEGTNTLIEKFTLQTENSGNFCRISPDKNSTN